MTVSLAPTFLVTNAIPSTVSMSPTLLCIARKLQYSGEIGAVEGVALARRRVGARARKPPVSHLSVRALSGRMIFIREGKRDKYRERENIGR